MKLLIKRVGIYLMMLLYGFILIPFDNEPISFLKGPDFIAEMSEGSSSDLSSIQIYYSEFESEIKVFSENEDSNKQKKNHEKLYGSFSTHPAFTTNKFRSSAVKNKFDICNSQTGFNYVAHSFW